MYALLLALALIVSPVPSLQLRKEYDASEAAANVKYRGRRFEVVGKVEHLSATYVIYLQGGVVARLTDKEIARAGIIRVGFPIIIDCEGAGKVGEEPLLLECRISS